MPPVDGEGVAPAGAGAAVLNAADVVVIVEAAVASNTSSVIAVLVAQTA